MSPLLRLTLCAASPLVVGCLSPWSPVLESPTWVAGDRVPFLPAPHRSSSGLIADGLDQMLFGPIVRATEFAGTSEADNVNAVDEVPDSSWFTNRVGSHPPTSGTVGRGPCVGAVADDLRWVLTAGKPDGDNPGFVGHPEGGAAALVKFDSMGHERATAADAIASRLLHAIGYAVPCNRIVHLRRDEIAIAPGARYRTDTGERRLVTAAEVDGIVRRAVRSADRSLRASASEWLPGEPLGPFRYEGRRVDDPNDRVPHERRRELRALRLAAAWIGRTDSREANTLDTWVVGAAGGHVEHHLIDFGDAFGSVWEPPMLGRRLGHSAYVDLPDIVLDWLSLGTRVRPWETARFGPTGPVLGYFDAGDFDPASWEPGYDNPAMLAMTERDGAWMARILARLGPSEVAEAIASARLSEPRIAARLGVVLERRRRAILDRYLLRFSPLSWPVVVDADATTASFRLCLENLATTSRAFRDAAWQHRVRAWSGEAGERRPLAASAPVEGKSGMACTRLESPRRPSTLTRVIVEWRTSPLDDARLTLHLGWPPHGAPFVAALRRDAASGECHASALRLLR